MQKYQKIKTCTKMALEADLCGPEIFVRVRGYENKERRRREAFLFRSLFSFSSALLEIAGPQDGKVAAYVKKFVLSERSEFTNFSKLPLCQGYWKTGLAFLPTFVAMTKVGPSLNIKYQFVKEGFFPLLWNYISIKIIC